MQTNRTTEPAGSPVPGVMPEAVRTDADSVGAPAPRDTDGDQHDETRVVVRRRDPGSLVLAKLLGVIRGDKYVADAYEPAWSALMARRAGATVVRQDPDRNVRAGAPSAVVSQPDSIGRGAGAPARTER